MATCPTYPRSLPPDSHSENAGSLPSYHKFRTKKGYYFYDFNTNNVVRVAKELFDSLDECMSGPNGNGNGSRGNETLAEARRVVEEMKGKGMLQRDGQEVVAPPYCEQCISKKLDNTIDMMCLELSQQCNLRCRYCAYSGSYSANRSHNSRLMTEEIAFKGIDYYLDHSKGVERPVISYYGGEPLLNKKVLVASVAHAKAHPAATDSLRFSVDTNGTLVDDDLLEFFFENNFIVQISLDGSQELHDRNRMFRNGRGSWNRVHGLLDRIYERDPEFYRNNLFIACTVAPPYRLFALEEFFQGERERELNMMVNFVDEEGIDLKSIYPEAYEGDVWEEYRNYFRDYQTKMCTGRRDEISIVGKALFDRPLIDLVSKPKDPPAGRIPCNGICVPGLRKMFIDVEGSFYPCERVGQDFVIGHVDTGLDRQAIDGLIGDYQALCEKHCHQCWAARLCRLCFSSTRRYGGLSEERKLEECQFERANLNLALASMAQITETSPESLEWIKNVQLT